MTRKEVNVLFTIIKSLQAKGLTILFVSHKLDEIIEIAERITVMRDGCIISTFENTDVKEEKTCAADQRAADYVSAEIYRA